MTTKKLLLQEAAAWRVIAASVDAGSGNDFYLCDHINRLFEYGSDLAKAMKARCKEGWTAERWSAYQEYEDMRVGYDTPRLNRMYRRARVIAALWLACEVDDEARGSR